jgi:hypothetical protein
MGKAADQVRHQAGSVAPELIYRFAAQATGFPMGVVMKLDECSVSGAAGYMVDSGRFRSRCDGLNFMENTNCRKPHQIHIGFSLFAKPNALAAQSRHATPTR